MEQTQTNNSLVLAMPAFDAKKVAAQCLAAIHVATTLKENVAAMAGQTVVPTFGGNETIVTLAIMQEIQQVTEKAKYQTSEHFVSFLKGGNKVTVPLLDKEGRHVIGESGNPIFSTTVENGEVAYKRERWQIEAAKKGSAWHQILLPFAASDIESFNKTLGEGLQLAETVIFNKLVNGTKVLKNNKALFVALQVGENTVASNFVANNGIEASFLKPETYKGKDEKSQRQQWNQFCGNVYQSLKRVMSAKNETLKVGEVYRTMLGIK